MKKKKMFFEYECIIYTLIGKFSSFRGTNRSFFRIGFFRGKRPFD